MNDDAQLDRQAETARLCEAVQAYWRAGNDTVTIAKALRTTEPAVCRILHAWQDLRWQMRRARA